jgi:hypothetical protein
MSEWLISNPSLQDRAPARIEALVSLRALPPHPAQKAATAKQEAQGVATAAAPVAPDLVEATVLNSPL